MIPGPAPRVSVVMPVFNGDRFIGQAVESILDQSFRQLELIVVDDGSTDHTLAILEQYASADPRLRIVRQSHGGLVAALNAGAEQVRAPYLARMDADDIALPDRFEKQVRYLDENPGIALVGGGERRITSDGLRTMKTVTFPSAPADIDASLSSGVVCISHPTVMMRTEAFVTAGRYRHAFDLGAEDYDLWLRLAERYRLANLPEPVLNYRMHASQYSHGSTIPLFHLIAVAAARNRRATGIDPIADDTRITAPDVPATLRRLGVNDEDVKEHLIRTYKRNLRLFLQMGNADAAVQAFRECGAGRPVTRALRIDYANALLAQARQRYAAGHRVHGSFCLLRACLAQPALAATRLMSHVRSALAVGRT